jgi:hypothetical protein
MFKDYFDKITWQGVVAGVVICSVLGGGIAVQESISFGAPVRKNRKKNPKRRKRRVSTKKRSNPKKRKSSKRKNSAHTSRAKKAMNLYHSGKARSLKAAWKMV